MHPKRSTAAKSVKVPLPSTHVLAGLFYSAACLPFGISRRRRSQLRQLCGREVVRREELLPTQAAKLIKRDDLQPFGDIRANCRAQHRIKKRAMLPAFKKVDLLDQSVTMTGAEALIFLRRKSF